MFQGSRWLGWLVGGPSLFPFGGQPEHQKAWWLTFRFVVMFMKEIKGSLLVGAELVGFVGEPRVGGWGQPDGVVRGPKTAPKIDKRPTIRKNNIWIFVMAVAGRRFMAHSLPSWIPKGF